MPLAPRGSPLRGLLLLGTSLSLSLPAPLLAAPAPLPDWGVGGSKPKPAPAPAPTPAPTPEPAAPAPAPTPAPAPAADDDDDVVMTDSAPTKAPSSRKARRAAPRTPKAKPAPKPDKTTMSSIERANSEREPIQQHAQSLKESGKREEALTSLLVGAEAYRDPILYLAAAEIALELGDSKGRGGVADDDRCIANVRVAQTLLNNASTESPRVDPQEHPALQARGEDLVKKAQRHKVRMSARRNGHAELVAGAVLATAGLASFGVMSGGIYLNGVSKRELAKGEGRPDEELDPLRAQQKRAETMTAAGAVAGAVGLALGIALITIGARDVKATRAEKLQARIRVAPTFGGLVIAGRF